MFSSYVGLAAELQRAAPHDRKILRRRINHLIDARFEISAPFRFGAIQYCTFWGFLSAVDGVASQQFHTLLPRHGIDA
jgi:hypothetical protein